MAGRIHTNSHGLRLHVGGRTRPKVTPQTHPHLFKSMAKYGALPAAPDFDYSVGNTAAMGMILANGPDPSAPSGAQSGLGDCTAAGRSHLIDTFTYQAGSPVVMSSAQTVAFYSASTGYVLGDASTDQGGDEVTVLTCWQNQGAALDGHAISGFVVIDPTNVAEVKSACYLFENLYFGIELADSWTEISGSGFTWDVGNPPDPNDGHCVVGVGGNSDGILIDTWGFLGIMTYAAISQFCGSAAGGQLFCVLSPEIINRASQKAPNGLDFAALQADFGTLPSGATP